ncbi:MAG: exodeoxyribonuclease III [Bacteroidales bacterium]|nr:exodeoxyribonuclease III [Bacteroidales bacterium]
MKKIMSYNVNGIRAALKKGFYNWLKEENPDIICIQETKAQPEQIDSVLFETLGYHYYWYSAQKKGYSGVGILTKQKPDHVEYGMGTEKYDNEGRFLRADYGDVSVISVYHPSGSSGDERQAFKIQWLKDFQNYIKELKKTRKNLIISGDYNICRLWIDIHNPERQQKTSGFLPEEREWFQSFVDDGFTDSFRKFNEEPDQYSWWSYRANARNNNKGWRIDYHMVSSEFDNKLVGASILPNVKHSDHCPVLITVDF